MKKLLLTLLIATCFSCKKDDILPGLTAEGKNTFGCKVNDRVWLPASEGLIGKGKMDIYYESGEFGISVLRETKDVYQTMAIYSDSLYQVGNYSLDAKPKNQTAIYQDWKTYCYYERDSTTYRKGNLVITKLDKAKRIIAGNFEITLHTSGCDTIYITEGRFDITF